MSDDFKEENGEEGLAGGPEGDEPMSFWEHFAELRSRLTKIVLGVVAGFVGSFMFAAEITREKLYLNLHQELPYALTVETGRGHSWAEAH